MINTYSITDTIKHTYEITKTPTLLVAAISWSYVQITRWLIIGDKAESWYAEVIYYCEQTKNGG